jgi:RNA polymerase sigma-70 factor (ECF subfamily)
VSTDDTTALLARAAGGEAVALDALLARHRPRLARMVEVRLPAALRPRVDADDIVQEACAEAAARLPAYAQDPSMPFFQWLRFLCAQKIAQAQRRHLGAQARDARREAGASGDAAGYGDSAFLADRLSGHLTSPSAAAMRAEARERLRAELDAMAAADREILVLRHFEQLTSAEAARELGIETAAASKRYVRALRRLGDALRSIDPRRDQDR